MKPMKPMQPMSSGEAWWPDHLGTPAATGSQNEMRYAFFPESRRLVVERNGASRTYDSGRHHVEGIAQYGDGGHDLVFEGRNGPVKLGDLQTID